MDQIQINSIRCYGYTGLLPEEQVLGQWFEVNLTLWVDLLPSGQSDRIEDTIDYRQSIDTVKKIITTAKFALVEKLAESIATAILNTDQRIEQVTVRLTKLSPPIPDFSGSIVIEIVRSR